MSVSGLIQVSWLGRFLFAFSDVQFLLTCPRSNSLGLLSHVHGTEHVAACVLVSSRRTNLTSTFSAYM